MKFSFNSVTLHDRPAGIHRDNTPRAVIDRGSGVYDSSTSLPTSGLWDHVPRLVYPQAGAGCIIYGFTLCTGSWTSRGRKHEYVVVDVTTNRRFRPTNHGTSDRLAASRTQLSLSIPYRWKDLRTGRIERRCRDSIYRHSVHTSTTTMAVFNDNRRHKYSRKFQQVFLPGIGSFRLHLRITSGD
jgi:hypothetical protein